MVVRATSPSRAPQGTRQSPRRAQATPPPIGTASPHPAANSRRQSPRLVVTTRRQSPRLAQAAPQLVTTDVATEGVPVQRTKVATERKRVTATAPRVVHEESADTSEQEADSGVVSPVEATAARIEASEEVVEPTVVVTEMVTEAVTKLPTEVVTEATTKVGTEATTEVATVLPTDANGEDKTVSATVEPGARDHVMYEAMETSDVATQAATDVDHEKKPVHVVAGGAELADLDRATASTEETTESTTQAISHSQTGDNEPMAQLAQLALDEEARASGTPRRRVTPPAPVVTIPAASEPVTAVRTSRSTRSKTLKFFANLEAQRQKLISKDRELAEKLAKEEEREVGLLSASTVDSGSEVESSDSTFRASPHIPDAKGRSASDDEDNEDSDSVDKPPPRKTPRYHTSQSADNRGSARGKNATKKVRSVATKPSPKRPTKRRRKAATESETDSESIQSAKQSAESAESAEDEGSTDEDPIPADILGYMSDKEHKARGKFMDGFPREFASWDEMDASLLAFQDDTYQIFKKRTSTNAATFNKNSKDYQIPGEFTKYAQTWKCTHAMKTQKKKKQQKKKTPAAKKAKQNQSPITVKVRSKTRKRRFVRFTGCTAVLNATVVPKFKDAVDAKDFVIRWSANGGHNHALSSQLYAYYPENRLRKTPGLIAEVQKALGYGGDAVNILHRLRENTGGVILSRDVHNLIAYIKRMRVTGTTVEDRLNTNFREFTSAAKGNWAKTFVNPENKQAQSIVFQSARMRRLFHAFPEVVMVDCTHSTNKNQFVLFSFVIHDIFGKGQYVSHSLMYRETMDNMTDAIIAFKKHNPRWRDIRCFVVDKDFKERTVLRLHFPQARILLCHYHVIKYLAKKVKALVRGTKREKDELIHICRALVYAKTPAIYDATVLLLQKKLGALMTDDDDSSTDTPEEQDVFSEEPSEDEEEDEIKLEDDDVVAEIQARAVRDAREDEEVKRGKKHAFFKYFEKNWESCKEEWVFFHRQNVAHLGNETNNRIEAKWGQMKRVVDVKMDMEEAVRTIQSMQRVSEDEYLVELKQPGTRVVHDPDPELVQLLHHVSGHAYELVKPEYLLVKDKLVNYTVQDRGDNAVLTRADDGDTTEYTVHLKTYTCSCFFAQVRLLPCRHVFYYRTFKNFESVIPLKFINLRWSLLNPSNDISAGEPDPEQPLRGRYAVTDSSSKATSLLTQGDKFCKVMSVFKPIAAALATQPPALFEKMYEFITAIESKMQRGEVPTLAGEIVDVGPAPALNARAAESIADEDDAKNAAGDREDTTFVLPSHAKFQSAHRDLRAAGAREMLKSLTKEAERFMLSTGRRQASVTLTEVQDVIGAGSYNYFEAIQVICGIPILETKTKSNVVRRRAEHVIADSSTVRFILAEPVIKRLLADFEKAMGDSDDDQLEEHIVAVGDGQGFLSISQLHTMDDFMLAIARVNAVVLATEWCYQMKTETSRVEFPFNNFGSEISERYVEDTIEALHYFPLSEVSLPHDTAAGADMVEITSDDWLHTTSIRAILSCLSNIKPGIAVIGPEFAKTRDQDMRRRMVASHSPFASEAKWIISIVNMNDMHWSAFYIDKNSSVCTLYDPLATSPDHNGLKALEKLVKKDVEPHLSTRLTYRTFTELTQDDGASCGVYAAVFLEIFLRGVDDALVFPRSTALFRMRYMRLVAGLLKRHDSAVDAVQI